MATAFNEEFSVADGRQIVLTGLQKLEASQLLENQLEIGEIVATASTLVSRRSVVAGGPVLMPLMVSILAPTPAAAKSPEPGRGKIKAVKKKIKNKRN
jgi:hypothetical protein